MDNDIYISVIIPAFNEEGNIPELAGQLVKVLQNYRDYEILLIDDGSRDNTLESIKELNQQNPKIRYISLSRNFGHQNAIKAGLDFASGDCVITMDADLQHPPELIPQLVDKWREGYEVVYTVREDDQKLSFLKRKTSGLFYNLMNRFSDIKINKGAADFRLLDRSVVEVLKDINEYYLFFRGMTAWVGFRQCSVPFTPAQRFTGETKYTFGRMIGFALTGITSFSLKPLRLSVLLGVFFAVVAFIYGIYAIAMKLFTDQTIPGWTSVLASVLFIGGIQLIVLGIIAEYIGKLFMESKRRPHYVIKEKSGK
ncbi:MAG: glycosyltransferase family 2 protein [bacterium]|nr:glycosyltransferase family 2 protein [bacterium]